MISFTLQVYREGDRWFFDDPRKDIDHEEFVGGVPKFLYYLAERNNIKKCDVVIDTQNIEGAAELTRIDTKSDPQGGISYLHEDSGLDIWLCPVFWDYFKPPLGPKKIWVHLRNIY